MKKMIWRADGTVRIENRPEMGDWPTERYGVTQRLPKDPDWRIKLEVGDEFCLGVVTDPCGVETPFFVRDERGIGGNMDGDRRVLHGWRGTTNGYTEMAYGWRRCLEIGWLKRGYGEYLILSADMKPDED